MNRARNCADVALPEQQVSGVEMDRLGFGRDLGAVLHHFDVAAESPCFSVLVGWLRWSDPS
jgi:hypothetical protein